MRIRLLGPEDAAKVQAFVRALSPRSKLERFFAPIQELSPRQLERITSGLGTSFAAFDEHGAIIALAEYAPVAGGAAEFGVVVADEWQGRGLGVRLLAELLERAKRSGIVRLGGVTNAGNRAMRLLAARLGFGQSRDEDPDLVRMELAVGGFRKAA